MKSTSKEHGRQTTPLWDTDQGLARIHAAYMAREASPEVEAHLSAKILAAVKYAPGAKTPFYRRLVWRPIEEAVTRLRVSPMAVLGGGMAAAAVAVVVTYALVASHGNDAGESKTPLHQAAQPQPTAGPAGVARNEDSTALTPQPVKVRPDALKREGLRQAVKKPAHDVPQFGGGGDESVRIETAPQESVEPENDEQRLLRRLRALQRGGHTAAAAAVCEELRTKFPGTAASMDLCK